CLRLRGLAAPRLPVRLVGEGGQAPPRADLRRLHPGLRVHGRRGARGGRARSPPGVVQRVQPRGDRSHHPRRGRHHRAGLRPGAPRRGARGPPRSGLLVSGEIAIVTGGTGALGQAISTTLLETGVPIAIPYAVPEGRAALEGRLTPEQRARVHALPADVTDEAAVAKFVQTVRDRYGRVDALVNVVGGFEGGDLVSTPLAEGRSEERRVG